MEIKICFSYGIDQKNKIKDEDDESFVYYSLHQVYIYIIHESYLYLYDTNKQVNDYYVIKDH